MGRSFSLLVATQNLRKELAGVEYASQKNLPGRFSRQDAAQNHSSPNLILSHMCTFASVLEEFHECIQDFREYDDGSINMKGTLRALCSDIKVPFIDLFFERAFLIHRLIVLVPMPP